jgi:hypothetical protein
MTLCISKEAIDNIHNPKGGGVVCLIIAKAFCPSPNVHRSKRSPASQQSLTKPNQLKQDYLTGRASTMMSPPDQKRPHGWSLTAFDKFDSRKLKHF